MNTQLEPKRPPIVLALLLAAVAALLFLPAGAAAKAPTFAAPADPLVSFSGRLDRTAVLQGGDGEVRLELVLTAADTAPGARVRTPTDLIVVLDRSGSMAGEKIVAARAAVDRLIGGLRQDDRFALISYADRAELTIPFAAATSEARQRWRQTVGGIEPNGSTGMSYALDLALDTLARDGRNSRVILISDGLANQGDFSVDGLAGRSSRIVQRDSVVSTVGVGYDFNEELMSAIADAGTGNYYYLPDAVELADVFAREFEATRETVATAVEVTIAAGPGVVVKDAAGYPLERRGAAVTFRPGTLFAGQERRIWVTLLAPRDQPGKRDLGTVTASYRAGDARRTLAWSDTPQVACVTDETTYLASIDRDAWGSAVSEDGYGRLEQEVAKDVREGRRDQALQKIDAYRAKNAQLNTVVQSPKVETSLAETEKLKAEVKDAFEGADQAQKQNLLSKDRQYAGRSKMRAGSTKESAEKSGGR